MFHFICGQKYSTLMNINPNKSIGRLILEEIDIRKKPKVDDLHGYLAYMIFIPKVQENKLENQTKKCMFMAMLLN
jgi:hypothetical protein